MASILDNFIYFLATVAYANFDGFAESYNYNGKLHGKSEGCCWLRERVLRSPQVQVVCDQCLWDDTPSGTWHSHMKIYNLMDKLHYYWS